MQSGARNLIIADGRVSADDVTNLRKHINQQDKTLVITRSPKLPGLEQLQELNIVIQTLDDYVHRAGADYDMLFPEARVLLHTWQTSQPFSYYTRALEYNDFNLWELVEYHAVASIAHILLWIETLRRILLSNEWQRVAFVGTACYLWDAFQIAATEVGFVGTIVNESDRDYRIKKSDISTALAHLVTRHPVKRKLGFAYFHPRQMLHILREELYDMYMRQRLETYRKHNASTYFFLMNNRGITLNTLLPVIEQLRSDGRVFVVGYRNRFPTTQLQAYNLNYEWAKYVPYAGWPRIFVGLQRIITLWNQLADDTQFPTRCIYREASLWSYVGNLLRTIFLELAPTIMMWIEALKHIFSTIAPRAVIAGTDKTVQVITAAEVARRYGIPSIYVQVALHGDVALLSPFYTDYGTVIDEFSHKVHVKRSSLPPERFAITGLPRWDTLARLAIEGQHHSDAIKAEMYNQLELDTTERLIVLATQPFGMPYMERVVKAVMHSLSHHPNTRLVIKLHPGESSYLPLYDMLLDTMESLGTRPVLVIDINLHSLLLAADLVIVLASNVGLEAAILDRPVLSVNFTGEPDFFPFVERGIAAGAYSEAEVEQQVTRLLNDPVAIAELRERRQAYLRENPQLTDGRATERVVDFIRSMSPT